MVDDPLATDSGPAKEREYGRLIGAALIVALILALGLDNRQDVRIGYLFGSADIRLVYVILVSALLGAAADRLFIWRRRRRPGRR